MKIIAFFSALVAPLAAHATIIDFNALPSNSIFGPQYSEAGYTLTGSGFEFPQYDGFAFTTYAGDGALTLNYKGPTYTLTHHNGGLFNFTSFDLGNVNGDTEGGTLRVSYDGATPIDYAIPTTGALMTERTSGSRLTSVAFSFLPGETANNTLNSYVRLDNLAVNAVPEPATWAMMLVGFGMVGAVRRRAGSTSAA